MKREQATKDSQAQVELHVARQKELGELMLRDDDEPGALELLVTAVIAVAAAFVLGKVKGWW